MSIIRAIKHRLGLSVTPANNFVLDASADNGTMKLARESGQDIMTVDAAGKVAFPQNKGSETKNATGIEVNFAIPVGAKKVTVLFNLVSSNGVNNYSVRLGSGGVAQNSGYASIFWNVVTGGTPSSASAVNTSGFVFGTASAATIFHGSMEIVRRDPTTEGFFAQGVGYNGASGGTLNVAGAVTTSGSMDILQVTTTNKVDVFDAGTITVEWEN